MGGSKGLAHVIIGQRGQLAHQPSLRHLCRGQLDLVDKGGDLLDQIADIVQQEDVAILQLSHFQQGGGTDDVVDESDRATEQFGETQCVRSQRNDVFVILDIALMR